MSEHDHTVVGWRAWYTEGRVYDSSSSRWEDMPHVGVVAIVVYHRTRPYRRIMVGGSLYWIKDTPKGVAYCMDDHRDALIAPEDWERHHVKRGLWVTDEEYADVRVAVDAATEAPDESVRRDKTRG